jgi:hypothetical protein
MVNNGFIINPYYELKPDYKICPFGTDNIVLNHKLPKATYIDVYFKALFGGRKFIYTYSGRQAINLALTHYKLDPQDCVTILTTSNNFYISGCVTKEIEKFCNWTRKIEENTKVIFVNHEFGFPYEELSKLKEYNLPIIEDCAHAFFSEDKNNSINKIGDFVIYSFPKIFPIQYGGLLLSNIDFPDDFKLEAPSEEYLKKVLSHYYTKKEEIIHKRLENYNLLKELLLPFNFTERFEVLDGIVPGVFLFKTNLGQQNLQKLKEFLYNQGIQCSVFYGENAFYIPVHQNLKNVDFLYFKEAISFFLNTQNDHI